MSVAGATFREREREGLKRKRGLKRDGGVRLGEGMVSGGAVKAHAGALSL